MPTGIDRVCLAYLEHFGSRAQAVIQRGGRYIVLSPRQSDGLFNLLLARRPPRRFDLLRQLAMSTLGFRGVHRRRGLVYLNVGHTGLHEPTLPRWINENQLRAVYLIHDLIPLTHPQYCRLGEATKHAQRMRNVLASAAGVIGNSQATLDELAAFAKDLRIPMPPSVAAWISGPSLRGHPGEPPLSSPYFVILGTIEGRKNHRLILDVWAELVAERGRDAPILVIIGQRGWEAQAVHAQLDHPEEFHGSLLQLDRCDDDQLEAWLGGARALLMPSFAEGFGLPVTEALDRGTPVIASELPVFREIGGGIPTFLHPCDRVGWKEAIESFIEDGPERKRQLAAMSSYTAPSWPEHFAIVEPWLKAS